MATQNAINLTASGMVAYNGSGTFSGRTLTQPAAGITISNADGTGGNPTFALANDLSAVEGLGTTGVASRTGSDTWSTSSITQDAVILGAASQGLSNLALTNGQLVIGSTGATPVAATLTDGTGINITEGAGTITIASTVQALSYVEETTTSRSASVNEAVVCNNASTVTVTIPTTASFGDRLKVIGKGAGGWSIAQNASEIIHFGNTDTTTGAGGSLASTNQYDVVELVCTVADTEWTVESSIGNITIV